MHDDSYLKVPMLMTLWAMGDYYNSVVDTTNATKYGALLVPDGAIAISWDQNGDNTVRLKWSETVPGFKPGENEAGFGGLLIDSGVRQLKGKFGREYSSKGAQIELQFQL